MSAPIFSLLLQKAIKKIESILIQEKIKLEQIATNKCYFLPNDNNDLGKNQVGVAIE